MKERKTALVSAVDYLARRAYTEKEIRVKLRRKAYENVEIEAAIDVLIRRGYLDDAAFCRSLFAQYVEESAYSQNYIRSKLLQKGFAAELVADSARAFSDAEREFTAALKILRRKYSSAREMEPLAAAKYLYGKGFEQETIRRVVSGLDDFDGA